MSKHELPRATDAADVEKDTGKRRFDRRGMSRNGDPRVLLQRLGSLHALTAELSRAVTPREVIDVVMMNGMRALGATGGGVCLLTDDGNEQELAAVSGFDHDGRPTIPDSWHRFPVAAPYPVNEVLRSRAPILLPDIDEYERRYPLLGPTVRANGYQAYMAAPLLVNERILGAINYNFPDKRQFNEDDREFLLTLAHHCAQALDRARLFNAEREARAAAERETQWTQRMHSLANRLAAATTPEQVGVAVLEEACRAFGCDRARMSRVDEDGDTTHQLASYGYTEEETRDWRSYSIRRSAAPTAEVVSTGRPLLFSSRSAMSGRYSGELVALVEKYGIEAIALLPVTSEGRTRGVIACTWHEPREFADEERTRMMAFASQASQALERAQAVAEEAEVVRTIERIGNAITTEADLHRIVQMVTDETTRLIGAQFGAFFYNRLDEKGESYWLYSLSGAPREAFEKFPMPRNTRVFEPTFRGTGVVRSGDITRDERYGHNEPYRGMPEGHLPVHSYLAVPVVSHTGEVLGGLFFGHEQTDRFLQRHERLVVGVAGWAGVAMDNARLLESQMRARVELENALRETRASRDEAEQANRAKSQFLAAMSHELRTPLNAIQGHIQLIEMGVHGPVNADQRDALERVQRSQRSLQALINDVLNFARIEAGRLEYHMVDVSLAELVSAVTLMVQPQLDAKQMVLGTDVPRHVVVKADPDKAQQILLNLLSNATKFTDTGGRIAIDVAERPDHVALRVSDTGPGIPADKRERIFDPFVQVHRLSASAGGIGLGLAISRDLARGMNGDLTVESEEGHGSTFTLRLLRA